MLMLIAFSVGNVWAGEVTITPSQALNDGGVDPIAVACAKGDGTSNPAISGGQLRLYQAASGKTTGNTITFSSESAITSIVFTFANSMTASNGSFSEGSYDSESSTWTGSATSLTLTVTGTTSGTRIYITNMVVTYADGGKTLSSIAVSGTPTKTAYYAGDEFDPAGLTVTGTYSDESTAPITSGITWSYDPSQVLSLNQTSIGVIATVSEIASSKVNVSITVTEAPAAVNYEKVTSEPADWSGEYILVYEADATNARVWKGADQANNYAEATIADGVIAAPEGAAVLNIAKVAESDPVVYTIMLGEKYIGQTSNANGIKIQDDAINNSISYNGTDAAVDIVASSAHLRYNSASSSYFRYYKSSSYSSQKKIQLYKKVEGAVKPAAELSYAAADQKKLAKLGDAFTAPELSNPHTVAVTYASNNTDVAEVASNGAVTIKAAGVATITASYDGSGDYKEGSASYTIGVTAHAGTETDPYVAADAKIAIDVMGTVENAYATGVVSNVVTTTLPQEGYITFYFSADGATTGQQIEAYKCYGLNSAAFEALSDVETGATVVVTGTLKKYNSTYEFDQNCHLISYEAPAVPKTHIANDQANPYTVAQAITFAADGVTYDLDDYVYVQGVVYDVKSFNNGAMNIFIKDANAENQFELYKCAGINDGNATTPFEALTDVQAGNIVIGYGQLTVYNTTYEFKQGNYLVDLQKPVTGVQLDQTEASVEEEATVTLTATILPSNATGTIVWSVESGDTYASVDENGVVTGIAEGEATIRATVQGTEIHAECTVTITEKSAPVTYDYALVTNIAQLQDGLKVIIVAAEEDKAAGSAAATYRNVVDVERTTDGNYLILDSENMPTEFTLGVSGENFTLNDGNGYMYESTAKSVKVQDEAFEWTITIGEGNVATIQATNELRYNSTSPRFTTYASGQQALQLYVKNDGKQAAGLAWSTDAVELTVGDDFEAPTLTNPNNLVVTITSDNEEVATVSEGIVSLVADATGTAKITASFEGDDTYRAASVSYTIKVNAVPTPAETKNVVILAEYNSKFYAMTNSLTSGALAGVEVEKDGSKIVVSSAEDKAAIQWTATVDGDNTTLKDGDDYYIKGSSGASLSLEADPYNWNWDGEKSCYISSAYTNRGLFFSNSGNVFKGYALSNITSDGYAATEVIEIDPEDIVISSKVDPALAYTPASDEITAGDAWSAPVLGYVEGFDGLAAITYESSNEAVATVTDAGVIALAGGTGTATITATFAGNASYLAGSATYTVKVNEPAEDCDGTDDFSTATNTSASSYNVARTTTNGWNSVNSALTTINSEARWLTMLGRTSQVGVITSPTLNDGIASLKIRYANTFNETNGVSFRVDIKQGEDIVKTYTITKENSEVEKGTVYTEIIENINVAGDFQMIFTNLCPSNADSNKDRVSIGRLCWSSYGAAPEPQYTDIRTGLTAGNYYTVCWPKAMTAIKGGSLWSFAGKDASMAYLILEEAPFEAGKPYIIYATDTKLEAVVEGDDAAAGSNNGLYGTLSYMDATALSNAGATYMLKNNELRPIGSNNHLDANRAYVILEEITGDAPAGLPKHRVRAMPLQGQTTTGIDALNASENPVKMMIDGQLFILRGEKLYDATGRLVK